MVELVCGLHHVSLVVTKGSSYKVELVHGLHYRSPGAMKLVMGLHQRNPRVMELEVGLHHGCLGSDRKSPKVVELVMRLHQKNPTVVKLVMRLHERCYIREQEVSRGGEASVGASPPKIQEGEVHDGTSPWESQGA